MALLVQTQPGSANSDTAISVSLGSSTTAGNCLVVLVGTVDTSVNPIVSGVTLGGSAGNFAAAVTETSASYANFYAWVDWNCAGGQTSVAVTLGSGSGGAPGLSIYAMEWSGIQSSSNPVDKTNSGNNGSSSFSSGATGTLTQANEVVIGSVFGCSTTSILSVGPSSPWTNISAIAGTGNSGFTSMIAGWQIVSATTSLTYSGTFTSSGGPFYGAGILTLKAPPILSVKPKLVNQAVMRSALW